MDTLSAFRLPALGFLLTVAFGFWLSRLGKPYNGLLFNAHKLIALGAVILAGLRTNDMLKTSEPQTLLMVLIILIGLCALTLFVSGAFLSIGNADYQIVKFIHNLAPVALVLAAALAAYWVVAKPA